MTILPELRARAADESGPADDAGLLWHHPAFCRFALPATPGGAEPWMRSLAGTAVSFEPGSERDRLPGGPLLRRLLIHLCDAAVRAGVPQVTLGDSAAALAAAMHPPVPAVAVAALEAQVIGLLACRITVATEGGPGLSMLDARGRPRAGTPDWRPTLRLNARFLENLQRDKVALDRAAVAALAGAALPLDIYTWLAVTLPEQTDKVLAESWPELRSRFGAPGQDADAFQAAFTAALVQLRAALPGLEAEDDAIGVGFSARSAAPEPVAAVPAPAPPPVVPVAAPPAETAAPEAPPAPRLREDRPRFEDRPREDRPRDDRPRDDRPRFEDRPRPEERPRPDDRPREDRPRDDRPRDDRPRPDERGPRQTISLRSHVTGLHQVIWLHRALGRDNVIIEVTPGSRYDPNLVTTLTLEPIVLQVAGGLHARDFERVSSWATANRDLIDAFWDGEIDDLDEIIARVRKVPAQGVDRWRG